MIGHASGGELCPGCRHVFDQLEPYVIIDDGPQQRAIFCFDCAWIIESRKPHAQ